MDTPPPSTAPAAGLPWEEPDAGLSSIFPTVTQFVVSPLRSFEKVSLTTDLVRPLAYFVLFVLLGALVGQLWRYVFWTPENSGINLIPKGVLAAAPWFKVLLGRPTALIVLGIMIVAPLLNLITLFLWSGVVHLVLTMVAGAQGGFGATLRVVCYSQTACIALIVPFAGGIVQILWSLVLQIIGLSQVHRAASWKASVAVLAPLVFCCGCLVGLVLISGLAAGGLLNR